MKNKIALASAAFLAAASASHGEIVVNEYLSFEGFVDMSYTHTDFDDDGAGIGDMSDNNFAVDEVEISWLFDFDPVTAQIDTQYTGIGSSRQVITGIDPNLDNDDNITPDDVETGTFSNGEAEIDQAFVTYQMDNGGAISAGRYDSMLGFEAFESPGLYQFSTAYTFAGAGDLGFLPVTNQGVKYTYNDDSAFFGISVQDAAFGDQNGLRNRLGGSGNSSWAIEAAGSMMLGDGWNVFLGGAYEDAEGGNFDDSYAVNAYTTYETGAWLFAFELNYGESDGASQFALGNFGGADEEVFSGLLMGNYAYSDQASITGRLSYGDHEADDGAGNDVEAEYIKYTLAHNYAFTDNLLLVSEVSYADGDDALDADSLQGALELIFTF